MIAITVLKKAADTDNQIKLTEKSIRELEDIYYNTLCSPKIEQVKTNPLNRDYQVTEIVAMNVPDETRKTIEALKKSMEDMAKFKKVVLLQLAKLSYNERKVITEFYLNKKRWTEISHGFYSERQCRFFRDKGLEKLELLFLKNEFLYEYLTLPTTAEQFDV